MPNTKNGVQAAHPHRQNSSDYFEFPLDNPRTKGYYNKVLRGGVAQLGARLNGIQKARGSSPLISTILQDSRPDHRAVFLLPPFNSTTKKTPEGL